MFGAMHFIKMPWCHDIRHHGISLIIVLYWLFRLHYCLLIDSRYVCLGGTVITDKCVGLHVIAYTIITLQI